jgi:hypothetical protein
MKIKYLPFVIWLFSIVFSCQSSRSDKIESGYEEYQLVWSDEFDYEGLPDSAKWSYGCTEGLKFVPNCPKDEVYGRPFGCCQPIGNMAAGPPVAK